MKKSQMYIVIVTVFLGGALLGSGYLVNAGTQDGAQSHNGHFLSHNSEGDNHSGFKKDGWGKEEWNHNKSGYSNLADIDRQTTIIDNGVVLELTSSDAEVVDKIQQFGSKEDGQLPHKQWKSSDITKDVELIGNGVRITITSDDPDTVTRLQEKSSSDKGFFGARWHLKGSK